MSSDRHGDRKRSLPRIAWVVAGLLAGVALTVGIPRLFSSDDATSNDVDLAATEATDLTLDGEVAPGANARSPRDAVEGFLTAEAAAQYEESYAFLSAGDRQALHSPAGWVSAHAEVLAPVRDFEIGEVDEGASEGTSVRSRVSFRPSLDFVAGLVPGQADVTWVVVQDEGGAWGVDIESTVLEPIYPSDAAAPDAVRAWARSRQDCQTDGQRAGALVGSLAQAEGLCGADGTVEVGPVEMLPEFESGPFVTAFGPETGSWARVVPVTAPVSLRAVVAPIGDEWVVVGMLS